MSWYWTPLPESPALADASVTVALTGQSVTVARGTLTPDAAFALSGQSLTAARGTVLQGAPLTGQSVTAAQGSLAPSVSVALTGQSVLVARGSVTAAASFALTGQSIIAARGSVVAAPSLALLGQAATVSRGSLLAVTSPALSGQALTVAGGSALAASSLALTGQTLTAARGTVAVGTSDVTVAISGVSLSAASGSLTAGYSLSLTGQDLSAALGSVTGHAVTPAQPVVTLDPRIISRTLGGWTPATVTEALWAPTIWPRHLDAKSSGSAAVCDGRLFDDATFDCVSIAGVTSPTPGGWSATNESQSDWAPAIWPRLLASKTMGNAATFDARVFDEDMSDCVTVEGTTSPTAGGWSERAKGNSAW